CEQTNQRQRLNSRVTSHVAAVSAALGVFEGNVHRATSKIQLETHAGILCRSATHTRQRPSHHPSVFSAISAPAAKQVIENLQPWIERGFALCSHSRRNNRAKT